MKVVVTAIVAACLTVGVALAQTPESGEKQPARENQEKPAISETELRELVEKLSSEFFYERKSAKKRLSQLGEAGATVAKSALASADFRCRQAALEILALSPSKENVNAVISVLNDPDISVRCAARNAIAKLGLDALEPLEQALKSAQGKEKELLQRAVSDAYKKVVESAFNELTSSRPGHGQYPGQYDRITKLGKVITPVLIEIATDKSHPYQTYAIHALGELGDKDAIPALKKITEDPSSHEYAQQAAACALYKLGEKEPLEKIVNSSKERLGKVHLAHIYHRVGAYDKAEQLRKESIASGNDSAVDHFNLACALAMQNKKEEAISELQKALEGGYRDAEWLKIDREIDNIRKEPQFKELMKKYFPQTDLSELTKDETDKVQKKQEENPP